MQVQRCSNVETADVKRCRGAEVQRFTRGQRYSTEGGAVEVQ